MSKSIASRLGKVPDQMSAVELKALLEAILADLTALRATMIAHTHGGITAGAGTSDVLNSTAPSALTLLA